MEERICKGFEKDCSNPIGAHCRSGLCTACYARRKYRESHPASGKRAKASTKSTGGASSVQQPNRAQAPEQLFTLQLTQRQVKTLIPLLLSR